MFFCFSHVNNIWLILKWAEKEGSVEERSGGLERLWHPSFPLDAQLNHGLALHKGPHGCYLCLHFIISSADLFSSSFLLFLKVEVLHDSSFPFSLCHQWVWQQCNSRYVHVARAFWSFTSELLWNVWFRLASSLSDACISFMQAVTQLVKGATSDTITLFAILAK